MTRHVVPTREVFHLWAHQAQDNARNSKGSVSFRGKIAYSYREPIGNIVSDRKGRNVALVSSQTFSVTTSSHQTDLHCAIGYGDAKVMPSFSVPYVTAEINNDADLHVSNAKALAKAIESAVATDLRKLDVGDYEFDRLRESYATLLDYCKTFNAKAPLTQKAFDKLVASVQERKDRLAAKRSDPKYIAARERANERKAEKIRVDYRNLRGDFSPDKNVYMSYRQRSRIAALMTAEDKAIHSEALRYYNADRIARYRMGEDSTLGRRRHMGATEEDNAAHVTAWRHAHPDLLARFVAGDEDYNVAAIKSVYTTAWELEQRAAAIEIKYEANIAAWRRGESVRLPHGSTAMLRVRGNDVETSWGARFPVADATRAYRAISALRARGKLPWHRNGEHIKLGPYELDRVDANGLIRAGCHLVAWSEVEGAARELGLT